MRLEKGVGGGGRESSHVKGPGRKVGPRETEQGRPPLKTEQRLAGAPRRAIAVGSALQQSASDRLTHLPPPPMQDTRGPARGGGGGKRVICLAGRRG